MSTKYVEIAETAPFPEKLADRVMAGEIFVVRGCLQRLDIFDEITATSLDATRDVVGADAAANVQREGFDAIHRFSSLDQIEAIADNLSSRLAQKGPAWIAKVAPELLGITKPYYFERIPNTRFHVPYDVMAADPEAMDRFAVKAGGGKLAPHPNHRDSWVGCPDNLINIWAAVGPIPEGNGLTIFPNAFLRDIAHVGASIAFDENPGEPLNFSLEPGDAILFHGDHLHSSVLNRTDGTRHAVSFRIVTEKPNFPHGHYHHYAHSSLAAGALDSIAELPASLAWSFVETRLNWATEKLGFRSPEEPRKNTNRATLGKPQLGGERTFALSSLPEDSVRAITDEICVARIGKDRLVAFDRKCPHGGGDLALGAVIKGEIACPWHNLRIDPKTGASACQALGAARLYDVHVDGDRVTVSLDSVKTDGGDR
jgi:nitrite reductase/ring-hydroxylating ferredoxin subunit